MDNSTIVVRGAREHNLRNVDLDLPRNRLIVFTGVSGSGKSSLAFDTLYAEGQRRYVESLSSYARQFLGQLRKPAVEYLGGLSPSISIQQKAAGRNPRSTVGTITEIHDYLRVLYARIGQGHCPECGRAIAAQSREQIVARIEALPQSARFLVLAPVVRGQKGEYKDLFEDMLKRGYIRARVDGQIVRLTDDLRLDRNIKHDIGVVVDRLRNDAGARSRLVESVEQALALGGGSLIVAVESRSGAAEPPLARQSRNQTAPSPPASGGAPRATGWGEGGRNSPPQHESMRGDLTPSPPAPLPRSGGEGSNSPRPAKISTDSDTEAARRAARRGRASEMAGEPTHEDILLSAHYACTHCDRSYEAPSPQMFSFNSPQGMCTDCDGLGTRYTFDPDLLVPDPDRSFYQGAIPLANPFSGNSRWQRHIYEGVAQTFGIDLNVPWKDLPAEARALLLHGAGDRHITYEWKKRGGSVWKHGGKWEGIVPQLLSSFKKTAAGPRRLQLEKYMRGACCSTCQGQRLNPQARAVRVGGKTLVEVCALPVGDLARWFDPEHGPLEKNLSPVQRAIAGELLKEIRGRLAFLLNVGLHYLTLDRTAPTLAGGEAQRIRLAGQIGCGLVGVLYILDEPSIGLHPRDNERLLQSLRKLRDLGNTVVVVEHDEETMRAADYIVDFGPGPGVRGGQIVAAGAFADILANAHSLTGQYLAGTKEIPIPPRRRPRSKQTLRIVGARQNNLKNLDVDIPLGLFVCVTGVSGSGKSSLINDVLKTGLIENYGLRLASAGDEDDEHLAAGLARRDSAGVKNIVIPADRAGKNFDRILGIPHIDKIIDIDQTPIGRTPRSNPATYIKVFDEIRSLYAKLPEAKVRGYEPRRFSFNRPGGRCEACEGKGSNRLEMDFLADVWVTCPVCEGRRFNRETLQIRFKGKSIDGVLDMDVQEALEHFTNVPRIREMLQTLHDVGLDYLKLGQPSPTLSGGEAQRVKLARELCRRGTGRTLYLLDEPTTGLHFDDIHKLLQVLHGFVEAGNSVVVIEHNLDVIKTADWVIDLGPEGGAGGGEVVCAGTPEDIARCPRSYTGQALSAGPLRPMRSLSQESGVRNQESGVRGQGSEVNCPLTSHQSPLTTHQKDSAPTRKRKRAGSLELEPTEPITHLTVQGARQHNLKNITVSLPRERMTVCCGPSGSGKSSLALDTIYAEGQRRYIESLSAYARQFLGQVQKPKVENITGLSPAICIEQKTTSKSPRSTVGTVTEIHDYLRILYARLGQPYCPACNIPIGTQTADEIIDKIMALPEGTKLYLLAPVERRGQEKYESLWEEIRRAGYVRVRVDGRSHNIDELPAVDHRRKHQVEVVIDRIVVRASQRGRLADSVEAGLDQGKGYLHLVHVDEKLEEPRWQVERFSLHFACDRCGRSFEPLNPHHFSFNSPLGWCPTCEGLGVQRGANPALLIRDPHKSLRAGALAAWPSLMEETPFLRFAEALARHAGFTLDTPYDRLEPAQQRILWHGTGADWIPLSAAEGSKSKGKKQKHVEPPVRFQYKGLFPAVDEASRVSFVYRNKLEHLVSEVPCTSCQGARLRADAAAFRFAGRTLGELCALPLGQTLTLFRDLKLSEAQKQVAGELLREIQNRLQFLVDVGLDYLSLDRPAPTLSGGEAQRIRLASQIGSGLTGVLYVLDEPTIGLHPRDNCRLLQALRHLRDLGNTLVLVEHDREIIAAADHVLDFGPGAGDQGGEITAAGTPARIMRAKKSLTGKYLSGACAIPVPTNRRIGSQESGVRSQESGARSQKSEVRSQVSRDAESSERSAGEPPCPALPATLDSAHVGLTPRRSPGLTPRPSHWLTIRGARHNNLKNIDVHFPLGTFIAVTGVSGSGKSSLINDILCNTLARRLHRAHTPAAAHDDIYTSLGPPPLVAPPSGGTPLVVPPSGGIEHIDKIINVDQDPIGNSPTSNPATYTGVFDLIRQLFAQLPDAKVRGYHPRRFSFNKPGGRCEACEGNGQKKIEMHFLPDVWVECDVCHGCRYNLETLAVRYKGRSIADVLNLRVSEALELFVNIPKIRRVLQTLADVGLDYLALGQSAPTLSGGEAQRIKLAAELSRPNTGRTLYLLDEPTTGLHFDDLRKLLDVLNRLVDLGNTVIVVEHNMDVIKTADWVIDLGPEAGAGGGFIVAQGTPEDVARSQESVVGSSRELRADSQEPIKPRDVRLSALDSRLSTSPPSPALPSPLDSPPSPLPRSHTAAILAAVLAAGPHAERPRFDPHAAEEPRAGDVELAEVGRDARMPWEVDGRRWHTIDRVAGKGMPCRWEGTILEWLDERIHELGNFSATDWNHRSQVEIAAPVKSHGWFLHASTGQEWLVWLTFRAGRNTFKEADLVARLGIRPLNDTPGLEVYGTQERVRVDNLKGPWQAVTILAHRLGEIDTPAFREFLRRAADSFHQNLKRLRTAPEDVMPWKVNGERWHLSDKGFPIGKKLRWERALLPRLLDLVRELEPGLEIQWTTRDAISLKVPGISRSWARWRTKTSFGLDCRFLGKKGQFNLSQIEPFGVHPAVRAHRADADVLRLIFQHSEHLRAGRLKELLQEHLRGFREMFGGKG